MTTVIPPTIDVHLSGDDLRASMERDVRAGLTAVPKQLPPVYFYDDRGSRLFDEITRLPEYYPTRAERSILEAHAKDIAPSSGADILVELGAGTCDKSRLLLDAMQSTGRLEPVRPPRRQRHHPVGGRHRPRRGVPGSGRAARWSATSTAISTGCPADGRRLFAFLGGTIGNLDPGTAPCASSSGWPA